MVEFIGRFSLATIATAAAIVFLLSGKPLGAVAIVAMAVMIRRSVETRHAHL